MNRIYLFFVALLFMPSFLIGQQSSTYNLSFANVGYSGTTFCVDLMLSFNQSSDSLGTSNLVFTYDAGVISNPTLSSHSLTGPPFYQVPSVTSPRGGTASFNIELGAPGFGDEIAGTPGQTSIATVCFDYPVTGLAVDLNWYIDASAGTIVYLDNETTLLNQGTIQNYSGVPVSFPVEWLDFKAVLLGEDVQLDWITATEVNNSHFEVERSFDGTVFEEIGQLAGAGNTPIAQTYRYTDPDVIKLGQDQLFYRLRQVDYDGRYSFSQVVELPMSKNPELVVEGHPNPFVDELKIQYTNYSEAPFSLTITNNLGQSVWRGNRQERVGKFGINTATWAQGVYFLSAENGTKKIVIELMKR
ncbi:MAG: T9SS type A sorting domain-containing protein [Bacteroidota bacterium]